MIKEFEEFNGLEELDLEEPNIDQLTKAEFKFWSFLFCLSQAILYIFIEFDSLTLKNFLFCTGITLVIFFLGIFLVASQKEHCNFENAMLIGLTPLSLCILKDAYTFLPDPLLKIFSVGITLWITYLLILGYRRIFLAKKGCPILCGFANSALRLALLTVIFNLGFNIITNLDYFAFLNSSSGYTNDYYDYGQAETVRLEDYEITNYLDEFAYLDIYGWLILSLDEKIELLELLLAIDATAQNLPFIVELQLSDLEDNVTGSYNYTENIIYIDMEYLSQSELHDAINTIFHESRHVYQWYQVYVLEECGEDSPLLDSLSWAQSYAQSFKNYIFEYMQGYDKYQQIFVEMDAREYAAQNTLDLLYLLELLN